MYGVTWSLYLEAFVATLSCWPIAEPMRSNYTLFWSSSPDMIHWDGLHLLLQPDAPAHTNMITYPAFLDPFAPGRGDRNFASIDQSTTLTYVRRTVNFFTYGAQLLGVNVTFTKT